MCKVGMLELRNVRKIYFVLRYSVGFYQIYIESCCGSYEEQNDSSYPPCSLTCQSNLSTLERTSRGLQTHAHQWYHLC